MYRPVSPRYSESGWVCTCSCLPPNMRELRWAWVPDPNQWCRSKNVGMKAAGNLKLDQAGSFLQWPLTFNHSSNSKERGCDWWWLVIKSTWHSLKPPQQEASVKELFTTCFPAGYLWEIVLIAILSIRKIDPRWGRHFWNIAGLLLDWLSFILVLVYGSLTDTGISSFSVPGWPSLRASKTLEAFGTTLRFLSYSSSRNKQLPRFGHVRHETAVVGLF